MREISIVFPNQLFDKPPHLKKGVEVVLIEEFLFFSQYRFHKQKIAFHRASMLEYKSKLEKDQFQVLYFSADHELADVRNWKNWLKSEQVSALHLLDPCDDYLMKRLRYLENSIDLNIYDNPLFLNSKKELQGFFKPGKKSFFQTSFYKQQRKSRNVLMEVDGQPMGGEWTYDKENRKRYPKGKQVPVLNFPSQTQSWSAAVKYVVDRYTNSPGEVNDYPIYPINRRQALEWLEDFFLYRFHEFGPYEDAIVKEQLLLHHSLLSPLLNVGLLEPREVLDKAITYAKENEVPINSLEGFVRQIMGWREFIRGMYEVKGTYSRTKNYWQHQRRIPESFYTGNTGIPPVDQSIKKVLKTGYCHHIERLMILGNFMTLCEFHPDDVYQWFMELFIDAYDWVMVPNVYGMTLFADGGTFATKPYISGSNYIKKMSDYPSGDWESVWDGLFWNFITKHRVFFSSNPRLNMMVRTFDKMPREKQESHKKFAEDFLENLSY